MALSERWRNRLHITRTVAPAVVVAFVIDLLFARPNVGEFVGLLSGYLVLYVLFFAFGRWLGKHTWPRRGHRLARRMLRRRLRRRNEFVFVSDRPDRTFSLLTRVWEVVGFAAGVSVLFSALLSLIGLSERSLSIGNKVLPLLVPAVACWATFVLVPYWLFARLGFRIVDPVRWLVLPLSRRYADRLKLSNGVLLLLAAGAVFNLAFRAGASSGEAVATALILVLRVVASVVVIAATAVAYYVREERRVARDVEDEALTMGIRDGRGMSDGDFLPRLPAPKSP
ncbi:MAG TPA: hypothetical protein VM370_10085 [Candidatus Thermoplasmatota archaeon]|nr:hypothetical protein [Candidatus Thermoplasmatota archaeon]